MRPALRGVDEKPHRHEERRGEHVPERGHQPLKARPRLRARAKDADDERAERERVVEAVRDIRHEEAAPEERQEKRLVVAALRDRREQPRDEHQPEHERGNKEDGDPPHRAHREGHVHSAAVRDAGDHRHHADAHDVLAHRRAERVPDEGAPLPAHLAYDLGEQGRGAVAYRRAEEERRDGPPPEEPVADRVAEPHHHNRVEERRRHRHVADALELGGGKPQPHREHQEHYAELAGRLDRRLVKEERPAPRVPGQQDARQYVAHHLGPLEPREEKGDGPRDGH